MKLKYHRLKPGGVWDLVVSSVARKLKYHRLKLGGVDYVGVGLCSEEVELPPAEARWCLQRNVPLLTVWGATLHRDGKQIQDSPVSRPV